MFENLIPFHVYLLSAFSKFNSLNFILIPVQGQLASPHFIAFQSLKKGEIFKKLPEAELLPAFLEELQRMDTEAN
ncbi:MAG: hypothetical protein D3905_13385 [Candidatus Electrothrix sp. AS4_5]|nr:hypothetical protein [Candidatus Electrothrix gigas]